ncbi:hypothetical protein MG293_000880 [Ovis ammon polii]|uniref:Uncharacterized protein n=1 Tax=Ovis ammon polii TaxID=230172 RepID=A0AAD4UQG6_OVIAM|nr:hypothetical protein MG293_000880 [Ovis ammon polii]
MRWQTEAEMEVVQLQAQVCQGFLETRKKQFDKRIGDILYLVISFEPLAEAFFRFKKPSYFKCDLAAPPKVSFSPPFDSGLAFQVVLASRTCVAEMTKGSAALYFGSTYEWVEVRTFVSLSLVQSLESGLTLCDPVDCSLPGSSVHGILQARILEWVAIPSTRDLPDSGIEPASLMSAALAVMVPSEIPKLPADTPVRGFPIVWTLLFHDSLSRTGLYHCFSSFILSLCDRFLVLNRLSYNTCCNSCFSDGILTDIIEHLTWTSQGYQIELILAQCSEPFETIYIYLEKDYCDNHVISDTSVTPWTVTCQASLYIEFPRQEYWNELPFPSPGDLPDPGMEPPFPVLADVQLKSLQNVKKYKEENKTTCYHDAAYL